ncbi:P27 family phage terminase small subunit [Aminobacter sp. AP02]|uniref:P27 family phage terminase small subunit n=1 Tax=Aminobacter sp. AP02 TaxID=2135737 RepID=UPI000D6BA2F2|nr:P27 family phage terminase small subunit [Aminobacter sp. AP02]PWK65859.1 P27 family predicted phage terminase small subunit [Aminobacter sp. AP02]
MGVRGPRPETPEIQALKGNPGKRKKRPASIKPKSDVYIPNYLTGDARECFEMIVGAMPPGTYAATDTGGVAVYASAWADHKRAAEALSVEPAIVPGSTGNMQPNPWFKIKNEAARIMMSMGDRLGLDPKARAALVPPEEKPKSKFSGLIGRSAETA